MLMSYNPLEKCFFIEDSKYGTFIRFEAEDTYEEEDGEYFKLYGSNELLPSFSLESENYNMLFYIGSFDVSLPELDSEDYLVADYFVNIYTELSSDAIWQYESIDGTSPTITLFDHTVILDVSSTSIDVTVDFFFVALDDSKTEQLGPSVLPGFIYFVVDSSQKITISEISKVEIFFSFLDPLFTKEEEVDCVAIGLSSVGCEFIEGGTPSTHFQEFTFFSDDNEIVKKHFYFPLESKITVDFGEISGLDDLQFGFPATLWVSYISELKEAFETDGKFNSHFRLVFYDSEGNPIGETDSLTTFTSFNPNAFIQDGVSSYKEGKSSYVFSYDTKTTSYLGETVSTIELNLVCPGCGLVNSIDYSAVIFCAEWELSFDRSSSLVSSCYSPFEVLTSDEDNPQNWCIICTDILQSSLDDFYSIEFFNFALDDFTRSYENRLKASIQLKQTVNKASLSMANSTPENDIDVNQLYFQEDTIEIPVLSSILSIEIEMTNSESSSTKIKFHSSLTTLKLYFNDGVTLDGEVPDDYQCKVAFGTGGTTKCEILSVSMRNLEVWFPDGIEDDVEVDSFSFLLSGIAPLSMGDSTDMKVAILYNATSYWLTETPITIELVDVEEPIMATLKMVYPWELQVELITVGFFFENQKKIVLGFESKCQAELASFSGCFLEDDSSKILASVDSCIFSEGTEDQSLKFVLTSSLAKEIRKDALAFEKGEFLSIRIQGLSIEHYCPVSIQMLESGSPSTLLQKGLSPFHIEALLGFSAKVRLDMAQTLLVKNTLSVSLTLPVDLVQFGKTDMIFIELFLPQLLYESISPNCSPGGLASACEVIETHSLIGKGGHHIMVSLNIWVDSNEKEEEAIIGLTNVVPKLKVTQASMNDARIFLYENENFELKYEGDISYQVSETETEGGWEFAADSRLILIEVLSFNSTMVSELVEVEIEFYLEEKSDGSIIPSGSQLFAKFLTEDMQLPVDISDPSCSLSRSDDTEIEIESCELWALNVFKLQVSSDIPHGNYKLKVYPVITPSSAGVYQQVGRIFIFDGEILEAMSFSALDSSLPTTFSEKESNMALSFSVIDPVFPGSIFRVRINFSMTGLMDIFEASIALIDGETLSIVSGGRTEVGLTLAELTIYLSTTFNEDMIGFLVVFSPKIGLNEDFSIFIQTEVTQIRKEFEVDVQNIYFYEQSYGSLLLVALPFISPENTHVWIEAECSGGNSRNGLDVNPSEGVVIESGETSAYFSFKRQLIEESCTITILSNNTERIALTELTATLRDTPEDTLEYSVELMDKEDSEFTLVLSCDKPCHIYVAIQPVEYASYDLESLVGTYSELVMDQLFKEQLNFPNYTYFFVESLDGVDTLEMEKVFDDLLRYTDYEVYVEVEDIFGSQIYAAFHSNLTFVSEEDYTDWPFYGYVELKDHDDLAKMLCVSALFLQVPPENLQTPSGQYCHIEKFIENPYDLVETLDSRRLKMTPNNFRMAQHARKLDSEFGSTSLEEDPRLIFVFLPNYFSNQTESNLQNFKTGTNRYSNFVDVADFFYINLVELSDPFTFQLVKPTITSQLTYIFDTDGMKLYNLKFSQPVTLYLSILTQQNDASTQSTLVDISTTLEAKEELSIQVYEVRSYNVYTIDYSYESLSSRPVRYSSTANTITFTSSYLSDDTALSDDGEEDSGITLVQIIVIIVLVFIVLIMAAVVGLIIFCIYLNKKANIREEEEKKRKEEEERKLMETSKDESIIVKREGEMIEPEMVHDVLIEEGVAVEGIILDLVSNPKNGIQSGTSKEESQTDEENIHPLKMIRRNHEEVKDENE